jgi:phospholipid-binding lipoprotein MlaA
MSAERGKKMRANFFGTFLIAGLLLAGSAMAEGNPDKGSGTLESGQVSGWNETIMKSETALSEPADGAVSEEGADSWKEAALKVKAAPDAEVAPNAETVPKKDTTLNAEAAPKSEATAEEAETEDIDADVTIADPIEPVNRVIFQINDKFYFWLLKPAAQGYNAVVPEPARISVKNFFKNVEMPIRLVNSLLQGKFLGAVTEIARFGINTIIGVVGFFDVAKSRFDLNPQNADFGQTLGIYGMGGLMYIVWPLMGPSTVRETLGLVGDSFLNPVSYINPFEAALGVGAYEQINKTSLELGIYEDMKEASVEPYIGVRDAYIQYRNGLIKK